MNKYKFYYTLINADNKKNKKKILTQIRIVYVKDKIMNKK